MVTIHPPVRLVGEPKETKRKKEKKRSEETQTPRWRSQKFSPRRRPPSWGRGTAKI